MKFRIAAAIGLWATISGTAVAQVPTSYSLTDSASAHFQVGAFQNSITNKIFPGSVSVDAFGNPIAGSVGVTTPNGTALYIQGVTGGVPLSVTFPTAQHFICDSGCGGGGGGSSYTVTYGTAIGTLGTPNGYKDASGNFQPILGDTTNGQWVAIKSTVTTPVTGTFWQATQPVSIASAVAVTGTFFQSTQPISAVALPLPTGAATQATLASILTSLGSPFQAGASIGNTSFAISGTLPAFATTPTFNFGTLNGAATAAAQSTGNTSLASIDTKTPALGQALSAASVPVVLPAAQITALTPPTSVGLTGTLPAFAATPTFNIGTLNGAATAANQTGGTQKTQIVDGSGNVIAATTNALNVNVVNGGSGGTASSFAATFPSTGTAAGMSQAGNMVALTGTSGNLNVQCANCSGSGVSTADGASFTAGSSLFAGAGGIFQTTATSNPVASGTQGLFQMTANRALFTNLRNSSGVEIGTSAAPVRIDPTGTTTQPVSATSLPLPTGAATQTTLASVLTALGSPFQAGGNIGNTSFAATQATASALNATVVGTGTFAVQAAQSGTWNITNVSGSVSLPTGASTAAKQPALGTAGAASTDVITVQGIAGGVAQPISAAALPLPTGAATQTTSAAILTALGSPFQAGASIANTAFGISGTIPNPTTSASWGLLAQGAATSGQLGGLILGAVTTSAPSYTSAQSMPLSLDTAGNLRVNIVAGGGSGGTSSSFGTTFPATGTAIGISDGTNMQPLRGDTTNGAWVNCKTGCASAADATQSFSITSSTTSTVLALVGTSGAQFNLTGTFAATVVGQISNDNTNWVSVPLLNLSVSPPAFIAAATGANAIGNYLLVGSQGARYARVNATYTSGTVAGTMTATTQAAGASLGDYINYLVSTSSIPAGTNTIGTTGSLPYPVGAVPITASATGTTAATTATLAGASGKTTYVCGYSIRSNATINANVTNTLTGVISGTMSSIMWVPANTAGLGVDEQIFSPCIPASATNTAIAAVSGAPGTGGLVSVKAWGFQL